MPDPIRTALESAKSSIEADEATAREAGHFTDADIYLEIIAQLTAALALLDKHPEPELEVWLCPVHERLDKSGGLRPMDNCVACLRNERDELKALVSGPCAVHGGAK